MRNAIYCELLNLQQQKQQQTLVPMVETASGHHELPCTFAIIVS